jgi:Na+/melibiose symporter-like transporter
MFACVNNVYWLTLYSITNLEGNKFVNGLILGIAELTSGIFSGFLIYYTSPKVAFQTCTVLGIVFNSVTLFLAPAGSLISYVTLFIAILGIGGIYTCLYVLIPLVVPKH